MYWFLLLEETLILFGIFLLQPIFDFFGQLSLGKPFRWLKATYTLDLIAVVAFSYYFS